MAKETECYGCCSVLHGRAMTIESEAMVILM